MTASPENFDELLGEYIALSRQYARVQERCSQTVAALRADVAKLQAEQMRLRAAVIQRDTALALAREDQAALHAKLPGLPKRVVLAQRVELLKQRVQSLMRERLHWQWHGARTTTPQAAQALTPRELQNKSVLCLGDTQHAVAARQVVESAGGQVLSYATADTENLAVLEASLIAADLVICQTGCLSHGAYWRVQDHCKRTGKTCVMVDQPQVVHVVRGHEATLLADV
ncbi:DUF2325 domain-containing protein [Variovorax sp. HJSM1_2]|uniref:DUF2325 domain-containing protein n=1 Tax=Variovorax sp. HJSM1_2 TaxID=3366263 RepID=UPI003BE4B364